MTPEEEEGQRLKRTTVRMPDFLYDHLVRAASEQRKSLNQLIVDFLFDLTSEPNTTLREADRNQLLGMNVGVLLALDPSRIEADGLSDDEKLAVIYGTIDYLRSKRDDQASQ